MFRMFSSRLPFRRCFPVARFSWAVVYCLIIFNEKKIGEPRCYRSRSRSRYSNSKPKDRKSSRCSHCCQRTATSSNQPCAPHGGALLCCFFILSCFFCCHKWQHMVRVRRLRRRRTRASVIRVISSLRSRQADLRKPGEPRSHRPRTRSRDTKPKPKDRKASRGSHGRQRTGTFHSYWPNSHRNSQ